MLLVTQQNNANMLKFKYNICVSILTVNSFLCVEIVGIKAVCSHFGITAIIGSIIHYHTFTRMQVELNKCTWYGATLFIHVFHLCTHICCTVILLHTHTPAQTNCTINNEQGQVQASLSGVGFIYVYTEIWYIKRSQNGSEGTGNKPDSEV